MITAEPVENSGAVLRPLSPVEARAAALANAARAPSNPQDQMWQMVRAQMALLEQRIAALEAAQERASENERNSRD